MQFKELMINKIEASEENKPNRFEFMACFSRGPKGLIGFGETLYSGEDEKIVANALRRMADQIEGER